jgi:hypothetical protein
MGLKGIKLLKGNDNYLVIVMQIYVLMSQREVDSWKIHEVIEGNQVQAVSQFAKGETAISWRFQVIWFWLGNSESGSQHVVGVDGPFT